MSSRRDRISLRKLISKIWLAALLSAVALPVHAEVRVSGNADALTVEMREASADEVLAALRASFNVQYRTFGAINRVVTGTYTGTLRQVLARLFDGQNYVIRPSTNGVEIAVFGPGASDSGAVVWGGQQRVVTKPPDLLPPVTPSDGGEGWSGTVDFGPPKVPVASPAKAKIEIGPNTSQPPVAVPAASPAPAPANPVVAPAVGSPSPVQPPVGDPKVEGWNG